ncbi:MAG: TolC family outer membrane protein [Hydrogenophaga sp.]|uniref:TolC family outer membrane protein n=1 Tax=Hydrogenophaga sp. TaxID=1904254 RepID=UPI00169E6333|nr:TolC family outer membrane protein [Hydrogenophaga sp.]NIM41786.1 TolC family outer membrane protein [Hydrogenophaga sp.]NIN27091.1 TolC family outer membrane protein [Hydrogenophaga sp.]NIN31792.1 TolC family outer membrane protein [Hydrogenophaga sp.]NIN56036.1 TolC family outer membrane protein [Hydrogenophaga sp.]NIO52163.1 TolC family outer membrane protein [Hydrogenophaga sp.]
MRFATPLRPLTLAVLMALGAASAAQAQSLSQLFEAARGFDATYLAARSQHEANLAQADQARAGLLPEVGLGAGASWARRDSDNNLLDGTSNSQSVTLSASQPLYRPANRLANDQANLSRDISQAQLVQAEQDLIVRTSQAYFDVLAAQDTLAFVRAQKTAVEQQLAAARRNFEVGTATVTDAREAQASFDLVTAQEIAAENDLRVKKLALDQLVGRSGVTPLPLAAPLNLPPLEPATPQAWVDRTGENHPAILSARRNLEIAELETQRAEAGHKPTVDLVGQYQVARGPAGIQGVPGNVRSNNASVGVQFNMPLFAGYAIQNRVKQTLALEEKARADLDAARRTVDLRTRSAFLSVVSGQGQVKALEAAETSSQSALEANQLGYQVGVRINIDVLNAQSQLFQTKRDLAQARYNVLLGSLRLRQASGELTPADLQAIDALLAR